MKFNDVDDPPFEMANLHTALTGIIGIVYISNKQGNNGCRIKYFPDILNQGESFVVSIPELSITNDTTKNISNNIKKEVVMFAHVNSSTLLDFWDNGHFLMDEEFTILKQTLKLTPEHIEKSHKLKLNPVGNYEIT